MAKPVAPVKMQSAPNSSACLTRTCFGSPAWTTEETVMFLLPRPSRNSFAAAPQPVPALRALFSSDLLKNSPTGGIKSQIGLL